MSAKKKTETPAEQKYTITVNERQLRLLQNVCEKWARMCIGQTWDMAEDLAWLHYEYNPDDPEFDRRILRRDACKEMLELAMRAASGGNLEHFRKTEDAAEARNHFIREHNLPHKLCEFPDETYTDQD